MDPSVHFLLRGEVPAVREATIHPIVASEPVRSDDDKIGFTVDVTMRLDQDSDEAVERAFVVPIVDGPRKPLADSA